MTLKRLQTELAETGEAHVANDELLPDFEDVEEAASATLDGCEVYAARKVKTCRPFARS